jgi:hypothetical protein
VKRQAGLPKVSPWLPADWEKADAGALQALARGDAMPHQQQLVLKFIIETVAGTYDLSFRSGKPDETSFAEGKRWVGLQLVKLLKVNLGALKDD